MSVTSAEMRKNIARAVFRFLQKREIATKNGEQPPTYAELNQEMILTYGVTPAVVLPIIQTLSPDSAEEYREATNPHGHRRDGRD